MLIDNTYTKLFPQHVRDQLVTLAGLLLMTSPPGGHSTILSHTLIVAPSDPQVSGIVMHAWDNIPKSTHCESVRLVFTTVFVCKMPIFLATLNHGRSK